MTARPSNLPVHAPISRSGIETAFIQRVLGKREARRLADLLIDAEREARKRIDAAAKEAEQIFEHARDEAKAILAMLPDFAALEAVRDGQGRSAYQIIRRVADEAGLPIWAIASPRKDTTDRSAGEARLRAIHEVAKRCPHLSTEQVGMLFGVSEKRARLLIRRGARSQPEARPGDPVNSGDSGHE